MNEILRKIRADLRRSMNGMASKSMREKGLDYKLNFGVDTLRLRELARGYRPSAALAEELWRQETRELRILATLLYPSDEFDETTARRWVKEIPNQEIREQVCMNLFRKLPYAGRLAESWVQASDEAIRTTGYWLLARLILGASALPGEVDPDRVTAVAIGDLGSDSYFLRLSAHNALKFMGRVSPPVARAVLQGIAAFATSEDAQERELYDSLQFEYSRFTEEGG